MDVFGSADDESDGRTHCRHCISCASLPPVTDPCHKPCPGHQAGPVRADHVAPGVHFQSHRHRFAACVGRCRHSCHQQLWYVRTCSYRLLSCIFCWGMVQWQWRCHRLCLFWGACCGAGGPLQASRAWTFASRHCDESSQRQGATRQEASTLLSRAAQRGFNGVFVCKTWMAPKRALLVVKCVGIHVCVFVAACHSFAQQLARAVDWCG